MSMVESKSVKSFFESFGKHIESTFSLGKNIFFEKRFENICFMGMGASGFVGDLVMDCFDFKVPVFSVKDSEVPSFVSSRTLVFICSYSGETRECLEFLKAAQRKNAFVVVLTSKGKLFSLANSTNCKLVKPPYFKDIPSRDASCLMFFPLVNVLIENKIISDVSDDFDDVVSAVSSVNISLKAEELANEIKGFNIIIYSDGKLSSIVSKWKTNFNEDCKIPAFSNKFPEILHNEIESFSNPSGKFYVIILNDSSSNRKTVSRMEFVKGVVERFNVPCSFITMKGSCLLARVWSLLYLGNLVSHNLALLENKNPVETNIIEEYKEKFS